MEQSECAQLVVREAVREELLLGDRRPLERLVQPRYGPGLRGHLVRNAPDVLQERGAVLLAVARM
jgi:hypothetical protein